MSISSTLSPHISSKLKRLKDLPGGWDNGDGEPVSIKIIKYTAQLLEFLDDHPVSIFPTLDGGVELGWEHDRINLLLDPDDEIAYVLYSLIPNIIRKADIEQVAFQFPDELYRCALYVNDCIKRCNSSLV